MHETQTIAIDDSVACASVSGFVTRATVLIHSPDGATSMRPLLNYCDHLFSSCCTIPGCLL